MYIQLTQGKVSLIDECDSDLSFHKWIFHQEGYARKSGSEVVLLHRVILERMIQRGLEDSEIPDHISGDGLDNRRNNLRIATTSQNQANRKAPKNNTSGYKGVHFYKPLQKWVAYIRVNYKRHHLGYFATPEAAYQAYCEAAKSFFGEYSKTE